MSLSMSERRRLAEIDGRLSVEDPDLARMMAQWCADRSRRHRPAVATGAVASLGTLVTGVVLGGAGVCAVLVAFGWSGLVAAICVAVTSALRSDRRSACTRRDRRSESQPPSRPSRPGPEQMPPWWGWWCVGP